MSADGFAMPSPPGASPAASAMPGPQAAGPPLRRRLRRHLRRVRNRILGVLGPPLIRLYCATVRVRCLGRPPEPHPLRAGEERSIIAFWHQVILLLAARYRGSGYHVLISEHGDGELIARIITRLGMRAVRGSSTRGGARATLESLRRVPRDVSVVVTPDGPRGPARSFQIGAIYLASRRAQPIRLMAVGYSRCWKAPTWDGFRIPTPFSRALILGGEGLTVPPGADAETLEAFRQEAERRLLDLTHRVEDRFEEHWRAARPPSIWPPPRALPP